MIVKSGSSFEPPAFFSFNVFDVAHVIYVIYVTDVLYVSNVT